jgi:RNA polymerase sigma-70 factor (ECF subfamily)
LFERSQYEGALEPLLDQAAGYARALLHNKHDAEDAVQEAALRGWQRIGTFDAGRPFKGWWFAILRNCCVDILRRSKRNVSESLGNHDYAEPLYEEPDWERLAMAMKELTETHREILHLRYFGELSYDDLAEVLSIPKGTVMSRLHLARKALASHLREDLQ